MISMVVRAAMPGRCPNRDFRYRCSGANTIASTVPHSIAPLSGHRSQAKAKDANATRSTKALSSSFSKQSNPVSCDNLSETDQRAIFIKP